MPVLARHALRWEKVTVTLTDERWVPPDHPDSNEGLLRRHLLGNGAYAGIIPLKTVPPTVQEGLAEASARLAGITRPFDVVFLGMGEDGHIASLFSGDDIDETQVLQAVSRPDHPRISMTPSCLLHSRLIILPISGVRKKQVFNTAMEPGPLSALPVRHVLHQHKTPVLVITD